MRSLSALLPNHFARHYLQQTQRIRSDIPCSESEHIVLLPMFSNANALTTIVLVKSYRRKCSRCPSLARLLPNDSLLDDVTPEM